MTANSIDMVMSEAVDVVKEAYATEGECDQLRDSTPDYAYFGINNLSNNQVGRIVAYANGLLHGSLFTARCGVQSIEITRKSIVK